jgi:hypothetical protein
MPNCQLSVFPKLIFEQEIKLSSPCNMGRRILFEICAACFQQILFYDQ